MEDYQLYQLIIQFATLITVIGGLYIAIKKLYSQYDLYRRDKAMSYSTFLHPTLQEYKIAIDEAFMAEGRTEFIPPKEIEEKILQDISIKTKINTVLNYYENIAIACLNSVADEQILFQMIAQGYINDYQKFSGYINKRREDLKNPRLYQSFESLANKWKGKLIPKIE